MSQAIDIVSLYPKDMNIYGDSGNVLTIQRRLALYGYEPHVHAYNQGDEWPEHVDMVLGGGGQDTGQKKIIGDFFMRALIETSMMDLSKTQVIDASEGRRWLTDTLGFVAAIG